MSGQRSYVVIMYPCRSSCVHGPNFPIMNFMRTLEPKISTLIQAAVIAFLLVAISFIYENEDKASAKMRSVAVAAK